MAEKAPILLVPWCANPLCLLCRQITSSDSIIIHHSEKDLKISAARGCLLCQFFFKELSYQTYRKRITQQNLEISRAMSRLKVSDYSSTSHPFEIFTATGSKPASTHSIFREIAEHADSEPCWELIGKWLSICAKEHPSCNQRPRRMPSKIIDVSNMCLVHGATIDLAPYATLSHCWGSNNYRSKTTTLTLDGFQTGLDMTYLPQLFLDAIFVTRKLELRYLWIDALCILQDIGEDWRYEAASMGDYYRDSFINISALSAPSGSDGFLTRRERSPCVSLGDNTLVRKARPTWTEIFEETPLSRRAWVLQERLLSTRVLHFEKNEMFWECLTTSAREGSSEEFCLTGQGEEWADENFKRSLVFENLHILSGHDTPMGNMEIIMGKWYRIVCQYSALNITFTTDLFPAIAGIARKFHEITDLTYVAGLWKEDAHNGLLWHSDSANARDHNVYVAPSWSWAANGAPVQMIYDRDSYSVYSMLQATILSMEVESSDNTYAAIRGAKLVLEAYSFEVWCRSISNGHAPYSDPYLRLALDIFNEKGTSIGTGFWDRLYSSDIGKSLAILISYRVDHKLGPAPIAHFLLVKEKQDQNGCSYFERIGIGQTVDRFHGYVNPTLSFEGSERRRFLLR